MRSQKKPVGQLESEMDEMFSFLMLRLDAYERNDALNGELKGSSPIRHYPGLRPAVSKVLKYKNCKSAAVFIDRLQISRQHEQLQEDILHKVRAFLK